jgi:hypothetical protein
MDASAPVVPAKGGSVANENAIAQAPSSRSIDIEPEDFVRFIERLCEAHRTNEGKVTFVVECPEDASLAGSVTDSWLMRKNNPATGVPIADVLQGSPPGRPVKHLEGMKDGMESAAKKHLGK